MITIDPPSTLPIPAARLHKLATRCAFAVLAAAAAFTQTALAQSPKWILTWSDEFNLPDGSAPDPAKWSFDNSGDKANHELETYTGRSANVHEEHGRLIITARKEDTGRPDGSTRHYTSGRIFTKSLFAQRYGRFEASIRLPAAKGVWPAFWLLGDNIDTVGWPRCGEIDIVEDIGQPALGHSTLHGPGYSGAKGLSTPFTLPPGQRVDTAFHLYAVEWAPDDIKFLLDDHLVAERTPADLPAGSAWVYNHPFFIILNLAVGGDWPGNPDSTTIFPQQMLVDYVRVYRRTGPAVTALPSALPQ
jgi:beta-glucanase (GH16 family)